MQKLVQPGRVEAQVMQAMHLQSLDCYWNMSQKRFVQSMTSNPGELNISHYISVSWVPMGTSHLFCQVALRLVEDTASCATVGRGGHHGAVRFCVPKPQRDKNRLGPN